MSKNPINQRFIDVVKHLIDTGLESKKVDIASKIGATPSKFSDILSGRVNVSPDLISKMVKVYGVNPKWLLNNEEPRFESESSEPNLSHEVNEPQQPYSNSFISVPFIGKYSQIDYLNNLDNSGFLSHLPKFHWEASPDLLIQQKDLLTFEMVGDSMNDGSYKSLVEGDILLGVPVPESNWTVVPDWEKWSFILVKEKSITFAKITAASNDDVFVCKSLNTFSPDLEIEKEGVVKLFRVAKIKREAGF